MKTPSLKVRGRHDAFLAALLEGAPIKRAAAAAGVGESAYRKWRASYPSFADRADRILNARAASKKPPAPFGAAFRKKYLGRETPDHQGQIIDLLTSLKGGEWGLVLIPPGFLKTATVEDYLTHRISNDSNVRCLVVSKSAGHATKIVGTVKGRLESNEELISDYGPFRGSPWTQTRLNVAGKTNDERDYSIEAVGMGGSIYGRRVDVILLDDVVDDQNAANYEAQFDWLQQVVATRLADGGVGIILGTRMAPTDLYERILQDEWPHKVLKLPAILDSGESLWEQGKPLEKLLGTRTRTKRATWALTYQQEKLQPTDSVFPLAQIESCFDSRIPLPRTRPADAISVMGFDPGLNHYSASFIVGLDRKTETRTWLNARNEFDVGEGGDRLVALTNLVVDEVTRFRVTHCVIEANSAFELFTGDHRLMKRLNAIGCNLSVVRAEEDGIRGTKDWLTDRPDLTFESLSGLFVDRKYKIPSGAGALKFFRPAISQFEDYPGGRKTPKDLLSAARLCEYGVLNLLDFYAKAAAQPPRDLRDYRSGRNWPTPEHLVKRVERTRRRQAIAERNERLWGAKGHFTRRLPNRHPQEENA